MLAALKARFNGADDFCLRELTAGGQVLYALFLDGMTSGSDISDFVVRPLMENLRPGTPEELYAQAQHGTVWCAVCEEADSAEAAADKLTHGYCVVVFPGLAKALCFEAKSGTRRGPSAPESENTVKGAKDAFTETIRINTALVRRHLRTSELRFVSKTVGRRTQTNVTVCSIAGLTDPKLVARMEKRLARIDIDGLLSPAAVEEYVTGSRRTAFPLLQYTERTDQFCQGLLEGQVGLLVDGLPLGYLAPVDLGILMASPEDRAVDYVSATCVRILRYAALFLSLFLPALYAAMATFQQQMLPTKLLLAIIESKENVPFPTLLEVLGLLAAFELLQEAGLHLPQAIGTAVSIIGGLVVGTAAVEANLVSPAALIVAATAGICGFTLPSRDLSDAVRLWRFLLTALGGIAGLFGLTVGAILLLVHLAGLTSLGVAYLAPFSDVRGWRAVLRPRLSQQKIRSRARRGRPEESEVKYHMKRIWIWLALLAAVAAFGLFPAQGTDAADLLPAQLLLVEASGGTLRLETDQGSVGFGKTLGEAMDDLQAGAKGQVFFGTVEHVVAAQSAAYLLPQLAASNELRPAAKLYLAPVLPEAADAVEFLAAHPGNLTLQRTRAALLYGRQPEVPRLLTTEGGLRLAG